MSKSPEDSRLSEHHPSFLEVVGDFTDMSFRVHFHSFYDLSVINCCCFHSQSGSCWLLVSAGGFQTLDFSMPFIFFCIKAYHRFDLQTSFWNYKVEYSAKLHIFTPLNSIVEALF